MPASQKSPATRIAAGSGPTRKPVRAVPGVEYLIGQVENMARESGAPKEFDAAIWLSHWLHAPLPALGNRTPASYMDTVEGQKLVSNILAMGQSGAYA